MVANQTEFSRYEYISVLKFCVVQMYKPWKTYKRICDVDGETCFSLKKCLGIG